MCIESEVLADVEVWGVVGRTAELRGTLGDEERLLEGKRKERDWMRGCDEVAARITARGATRVELDEWVIQSGKDVYGS